MEPDINDLDENNNQIVTERKTKRRRITDEVDFTIPQPGEFTLFATRKYRVHQLKTICKHYNLKVCGNKDDLTSRVYNYLRISNSAIVMQTKWRKVMNNRYLSARGPAYLDRSLCINKTDFFTTQDVSDIPSQQFISFKCSDGFIYGFDILSLHTLISKGIPGKVQNPYNRYMLHESVYDAITYICKTAPSRGENVIITAKEEVVAPIKQMQLQGLSLFQHIQEVTSYVVDHLWWWELSIHSMIKFIRELCDIWEYRAQLDPSIKREICPPDGNAFNRVELNGLRYMSLEQLRTASIAIIDRLVKHAISAENQALGANYVICALTLVSEDAAIQFPWLYQSVAY